jgi:hypothetical protein
LGFSCSAMSCAEVSAMLKIYSPGLIIQTLYGPT